MAQNRWVKKWGYGYAGTNNADVILLTDELGITEEEVAAMTDDEVQTEMSPLLWEEACQQVETYCRPAKESEIDWRSIGGDD